MKYTILFLIAAVLFSSCDLTKRRYMPGYSVNWGHKTPKTIVNKEPATASVVTIPVFKPIPIKELSSIPAPVEKWTVPTPLKPIPIVHSKSTTLYHIASNSKESVSTNSTIKKESDTQPQFYTGDEQEDDHAKKSLIFGILALGSPAATFLIMLGIVLSVGGTLAKPVAYSLVIFGLGCFGGLLFAIFAIINGFIAINEINAAPDTYSGKGDAILGIILATLVPIGIAAYILVRYLF